MIYIDRDRTDSTGQLIRPNAAWFGLSERWVDDAIRDGPAHEVRESVYRHPSVKIALEELFHRKCAYCETPLSEVDWQVEHFRPKGRVAERSDHPGYYWLAYEWTNLYPSCAPCNQSREDKPIWGDPVTGATLGKADQFPVEDEAVRVMAPGGDLIGERPLLLDPCSDRPERSFRYTRVGEIESVPDDRRSEASIRVFHLSRRRLRDRRREHMEAVILVLRLVRRLRKFEPEKIAEIEQELDRKWFSDSAPFAGAARSVRNDPDAFGV